MAKALGRARRAERRSDFILMLDLRMAQNSWYLPPSSLGGYSFIYISLLPTCKDGELDSSGLRARGILARCEINLHLSHLETRKQMF